MEKILIVWKVSGQPEKFFEESGKFLDSLEGFRTVWKISEQYGEKNWQSGKFLYSLESFQTTCKVNRQSGKSINSLTKICSPKFHCINLWNHIDTLSISFFVYAWVDEYKFSKGWQCIKTCCKNNLRTLVHVAKTIYALLAHMSRKQFTHFVRKVFARKSLSTGKLRLFRSLHLESTFKERS